MPGLEPGIQARKPARTKRLGRPCDGRVKPSHDAGYSSVLF
jgi:hypothetical protein